jgi:hypothetical protein
MSWRKAAYHLVMGGTWKAGAVWKPVSDMKITR